MKVKFQVGAEGKAFVARFGKLKYRDVADEVSELVARASLEWMLNYIASAPFPPRKDRRRSGVSRPMRLRNAGIMFRTRGGNLDDSGAYLRSLRAVRFGAGMWGLVAKDPLGGWLEKGTKRQKPPVPRPHFEPTWQYARSKAPQIFVERMRRALS
jgi:hypothetical protein